jgi:hypothetical protein
MSKDMSEETFEQRYTRLANSIGEAYNADVLLYTGDIDDVVVDELITLAKKPDRKENIFLMLTTHGGSPDAAYRMARCLKRHYKKLILYIYGICKSAGTLVSIGADEIILSDFGEFGPLDIQLGKKDELFETISGLNITQALNSLNTRVLDMFRDTLIDLKTGSRGQLSTKLAAEIASDLTEGLYGKIYAQIDPANLGSIERSIQIASEYGNRLARNTKNVKKKTIDKLVAEYPSHNFVIDLDEAKELFEVVRLPNEIEEGLAKCLSHVTRDPAGKPFVSKLNSVKKEETDEPIIDEDISGERSTAETQSGSKEDNSPSSEANLKTFKRPRAV